MNRNMVFVLTACLLVLALLAGCAKPAQDTLTPTEPQPTVANTEPSGASDTAPAAQAHESKAEVTPLGEISAAKDYEEIRTSLCKANESVDYGYGGYGGDDDVAAETAEEEPMAFNAEGGADLLDVSDYGTNVQVAGIDEADSVKTDGTYIYILDGLTVRILEAKGADTVELGSFALEQDGEALTEWEQPDENNSVSRYSSGMFYYNHRLAILYTVNRWGSDEEGNWFDKTETRAAIYAVQDGTLGELLANVGQDGYYQSARMKDGVLYLVTTNSVYSITDDSEPEAYIPCVYNDADAAMLPADRVYLCPEVSWPSFTVVGSYAMETAESLDACAFTGSTDNVYMNADALYLARSVQKEDASEPYTENQYTVVDYISSSKTEIKRISIGDSLTLDASCTLDGNLLNQFALDEYDGNLRAATSTYSYRYSIFRDEAYDFENYVWQDNGEMNSRVTILDSDLNEIGCVDNLAADERIYSVRFFGEVGYVVTYKNIDPVFTLDLSDPTNPTVESALEVPGVSNYLHVFANGKLFGFGQAVNADAVNASIDGLQLSMFDVSDPKNVTLEAQEVIEDSYSNALYDHHAILIQGSQNLIGFPMTGAYDWGNSYMVYSYENGAFVPRGKVLLDYYPENARGIMIDGMLYICSSYQTYVLDLQDYAVIADISSAVG